MEVLEILYKKHKDWCDIVESFGVNKDTAEDLVMEMYIKIDKLVKQGKDIMYNETEVNYYYIYRTLQCLFLDLKRKESKVSFVDLDQVNKIVETNIDYKLEYEKVTKEIEKLYWYDKRVFELIEGGVSCQTLSEQTKIPYYRLYNTYRKVKEHLKDIFNEKIKN